MLPLHLFTHRSLMLNVSLRARLQAALWQIVLIYSCFHFFRSDLGEYAESRQSVSNGSGQLSFPPPFFFFTLHVYLSRAVPKWKILFPNGKSGRRSQKASNIVSWKSAANNGQLHSEGFKNGTEQVMGKCCQYASKNWIVFLLFLRNYTKSCNIKKEGGRSHREAFQ